MSKVLITGGAGFIGNRLAEALLKEGKEVIVLDNLSPQIHGKRGDFPDHLKNLTTCIKGDILDSEMWDSLPEEIESVVHLAAETGTGQSMYELGRYVETNILGTVRLLEFIQSRKNSIKRIVLSSSRAVYGEGAYSCPKHGVVYPKERRTEDFRNKIFDHICELCGTTLAITPTPENAMLNPQSIYGVSKLTQEQLIQVGAKSNNIPYTILRFQNVYGPGQSLSNPYTGILSIFSTRIKNGKEIQVFEDGNESRDFVFVDDIISAILLSLENEKAKNKIYNVGSGEATSVKKIAEMLLQYYNSSLGLTITGNYRAGDIRHNFADISLIGQELGFHPKVNLETGLKLFTDWVLKQEHVPDFSDQAMHELKNKGLFN